MKWDVVKRKLPMLSYATYIDELFLGNITQKKSSSQIFFELIGHVLYAAPFIVIGGIFSVMLVYHGEMKNDGPKIFNNAVRYDRLFDQIMGDNGYADSNKDGIIDLHEYNSLLNIMQIKLQDQTQISQFTPSLENLESAIAIYEKDNSKCLY